MSWKWILLAFVLTVILVTVVGNMGGVAAEEPAANSLVVDYGSWTQIGKTKISATLIKTADGHSCVIAMGGVAMSVSCY